MTRRKRFDRPRASAALAATLVLGMAASASALPTDWLEYTAIAKNRLDIGSNIEVSGNYAVTQPGGRLTLGTNLFHNSVPADSFLAADQMEFVTGASANNVSVNALQLNGTSEVRGATTSPLALPIAINVPALPAAVTNPCADGASNVTVTPGQTKTLAPGCYRNLLVNNNGVLELSGGDYIFRQVLVEVDAQVIAKTASVVSVQTKLVTELRAFVSPQSAKPADLQIFIGGAHSQIGNDGLVIGRIVAPNDMDFVFGPRVSFVGTVYADELNIFGVHQLRTPTPTPTRTPPSTPTPTPTQPFVPPTPTPTPTPPGSTPTPTPPGQTPTPTPPPTPTPTFVPPTPTEPFTPPEECPSFTSPNNC